MMTNDSLGAIPICEILPDPLGRLTDGAQLRAAATMARHTGNDTTGKQGLDRRGVVPSEGLSPRRATGGPTDWSDG